MSHTFVVNNNDVLDRSPREMDLFYNRGSNLYRMMEVSSKIEGKTEYATPIKVIGGSSPLFHTVSHAFNRHVPLIITPDAVWLTILVGLSHHVDQNAEELRNHFVQHEGKVELEVLEGTSLSTFTEENWKRSICGFSEKVKDHIGKKHDLIVSDFSTTTETDKLSSELALMGAMKHYFSYKLRTLCGLNRVTVEGTSEDWSNITQRVQALSEFGLSWWTDHLLPVIDQLKSACEGKPELDFWQRVYKSRGGGSGSQPGISGWINSFHPYIAGRSDYVRGQKEIAKYVKNDAVNWEKGNEIEECDFPFGLVHAPVLFDDNGMEYDFKFYGGLVGVAQYDDLSVEAVSGFCIQNLGRKEND